MIYLLIYFLIVGDNFNIRKFSIVNHNELKHFNRIFFFTRPEDQYPSSHIFYSEIKNIFYKPEAVSIIRPNEPLLASSDRCPFTSSVAESIPLNQISSNFGNVALFLKFKII